MGGWGGGIHFDFVIKVKFLRMLKGMIPVRDTFIYISYEYFFCIRSIHIA